MQGKLLRLYQIQKESSQSSYYQGTIALECLTRLSSLLKSDQSEIIVRFGISASEYDCAVVKAHVETKLTMECQRCLNPVLLPVDLDFELLIDAADDVVRESGIDTVYSQEGAIDIFEVVEDELILGLPLVAMHEGESCHQYWQASDNVLQEVEKENPFLVLEKLKKTH